jgi:hypothetical protein
MFRNREKEQEEAAQRKRAKGIRRTKTIQGTGRESETTI